MYIYKNESRIPVYVGKARDLSKRIKQYWINPNQLNTKTQKLVKSVRFLETIETSSEFDALLLEAKLIREWKPKYNIIAKDDKSPLYISIDFVRDLPAIQFLRLKSIPPNLNRNHFIVGPFQSGRIARQLLRSIRKIVPYCTQKQRNGKRCFYTHLGLCEPCPSYIEKMPESIEKTNQTKLYRSHLFHIRDILSGKSKTVISILTKEMEQNAQEENFENAAKIRNQIQALYDLLSHKYDPSIYLETSETVSIMRLEELDSLTRILQAYYPALHTLRRIECIDISNLFGANAVGSLVVLTDGSVDSAQYRKFKIKGIDTANDPAMIAEVISRRFTHHQWDMPSLLVVDGGKTQVSAARDALKRNNITVPLIGLAKRQEEIVIPKDDDTYIIVQIPFTSPALHIIERLRDEAHRFAITYHRKLGNARGLSALHKKI